MRLLVTGATGYLGSRVIAALRRRGHHPLALVRSVAAAGRLRAQGIETVPGDLAQPSTLRAAALATEGAIHTAFGHGTDFQAAVEEERRAVAALIEAYAGTGRPLVVATATGVLGDTGPDPVDEDFPGQPDFPGRIRMGVEADVTAAAARGVRGIVVRPAILVHGHGASQFVPLLVQAARSRGVAGYPGEGLNRIATVHVDDLAELFVRAAEDGRAGAIYHGAGGEIATGDLARAIATGNPGVTARSVSPDEAAGAWGPFPAMLLSIDNRASGDRARRELGWQPYRDTTDLAHDLAEGSYAADAAEAE